MIKLVLKELLVDLVIPVTFKLLRKLLDETEETARRKVSANVPTTPEDFTAVQERVKQAKDAVDAIQGLRKTFKRYK